MENLQPLDAYTEAIATQWKRQGWVVGAAFGLVMALVTPWMGPMNGSGQNRRMVMVLAAFVGGGWLFGFGWSRWMTRSMRSMTERVYRGTAPFAVDVPSGDYGFRLPASLRVSDRVAIGGVLFLGRSGLAFVPHGLNLPSQRNLTLVPVDRECTVALVPQRSTVIRTLLFGALPALVRVTCQGTSLLVLVPRPEDTVKKIHDIVSGARVIDRAAAHRETLARQGRASDDSPLTS